MKTWYIRNNDEHLGPYSLEELRIVGLYSDDYVWKEGLPQWTKAEVITELKEHFISVEHSLFAPETYVVTDTMNYPRTERTERKSSIIKEFFRRLFVVKRRAPGFPKI